MDSSKDEKWWLRLAIRADVRAIREMRSLPRQELSGIEFFEMLIALNLYDLNQRRRRP